MGVPGKNNTDGYYRSITSCDRCSGRAIKCDADGIEADDCTNCQRAGVPCEWSFRSKQTPRGRPAQQPRKPKKDKKAKDPAAAQVQRVENEELSFSEKPSGRRSRYLPETRKEAPPDSAIHGNGFGRKNSPDRERDPPSSDLSDAPSGDDERAPFTSNGRQRVRSESAKTHGQAHGDPASQRRPVQDERARGGETGREGASERKKLAVRPPRPIEKSNGTPHAGTPAQDRHEPTTAAEDAMAVSKGLKRKTKVIDSDDEDDAANSQPKAGPSRLPPPPTQAARTIVQKVRPDKKGGGAGFFDDAPAPGSAGLKLKISLNASGGPKAQKVTSTEEAPAEPSARKRPKMEKQHSSTSLSAEQPERKKRRATGSEAEGGAVGEADKQTKADEPETSKRPTRERSKRRMQRHDFTDSSSEEEVAKPKRKRNKSEDAEYREEAASDGQEESVSRSQAPRASARKTKTSQVLSDPEADEPGPPTAAHRQLKTIKREDSKASALSSNAGTPDSAARDRAATANGSKAGTPMSEKDRTPIKKPVVPVVKKAVPARDSFADTLMRMSGVVSGGSTPAKKEEKPKNETNGKGSAGPRFRVAEKEERNRQRKELYTSAPVLDLMAPGHLISSYEAETRIGSALAIHGRRDELYNNVKSGQSIAILQGLLALKNREALLKAA